MTNNGYIVLASQESTKQNVKTWVVEYIRYYSIKGAYYQKLDVFRT